MGAVKNINVAGAATEQLTDPVTAGADITVGGYRVFAADGTTAKTKYKAFTTGNKTLSAGGQLKIVDLGIKVTMGTQNSTADEFANATMQTGLDAMFLSSDILRFYAADGTTALNTRLPDFASSVWDWDSAIAWV